MAKRCYSTVPTPEFIKSIYDSAADNAENMKWIQESVDAKGRIQKAISYMESAVKDHGYFSNDTLCYILCGIDFDTFELECRREKPE